MEQQLKKVLVVTNLPTPYKIDFYEELGKYCKLTVVIEARRLASQKFNWNDDTVENFTVIYQNEGYLDESKINFSILKHITKKFDHIIISAYYMKTELLALAFLKLIGRSYWFESDGGMINRRESEWQRRFKNFFILGAKGYLSPGAGTDEYLAYYKAEPTKIHRYPFTSLSERDILAKPVSLSEKRRLRDSRGIEEEQMVLAIGQFIHRKGFDVLMQSASRMSRDIGFYFVGGEATDEYLQMKEKLNLSNIHFVGFKTKEELAIYYKMADVFVLPTREDIWGLVINEAMAYGLPVVTTKKCVAGMELINDRHCLIDVEDVERLAESISRILTDEQLRNQLSIQNLNKIKDYTIEKMAEAHAQILKL